MTTALPLPEEDIQRLISKNVKSVFSTMLDLEIVSGKGGSTGQPVEGKSVIALLGFTGPWNGTGMIQCSDRLGCLIGSRLFFEEFTEVNDEVLDGIGEIANMVIGNFKEDASDRLGVLSLGTPTVILGDHFQTRMWQGHQWVDSVFECEGELFKVRLCLVACHAAVSSPVATILSA